MLCECNNLKCTLLRGEGSKEKMCWNKWHTEKGVQVFQFHNLITLPIGMSLNVVGWGCPKCTETSWVYCVLLVWWDGDEHTTRHCHEPPTTVTHPINSHALCITLRSDQRYVPTWPESRTVANSAPGPRFRIESLCDTGPENKITPEAQGSHLHPCMIWGQSNGLTPESESFAIYSSGSRSYGRGYDAHLPAASQVYGFNTQWHPVII